MRADRDIPGATSANTLAIIADLHAGGWDLAALNADWVPRISLRRRRVRPQYRGAPAAPRPTDAPAPAPDPK